MLEDTSPELLKSIERSRKETNVKIQSLSRLLEALHRVEGVLGPALARLRASGEQSSSELVMDIIEPSMLDIRFTFVKKLPITVCSKLLRRKQAESERELSALRKEELQLETRQNKILEDMKLKLRDRRDSPILPRIEEDRPCTPSISFRRVCCDENGLLNLSEEFTCDENVEVESSMTQLPSRKSRDSSFIRNTESDDLYSDLIDFDVMEKLQGMDPKERGEYTAQFYGELFDGNGWLLTARRKDHGLKASLSVEKKYRTLYETSVSCREGTRARKKDRDIYNRQSSELARLFTGKKKDGSRDRRCRKIQTQKAVQCQEQVLDPLISRNLSEHVSRRTQETQRLLEILQEEEETFSPLLPSLGQRKQKVTDGVKPLKGYVFRNSRGLEIEMTSH